MKKQKILVLIPLLLVIACLVYAWAVIMFTTLMASWRQYAALLFFVVPVVLFFKNFKASLIAMAIYLALALFNVFSLTSMTYSMSFGFMGLNTPDFQPLALGLLILLAALNLNTFVDMYLDYKGIQPIEKPGTANS